MNRHKVPQCPFPLHNNTVERTKTILPEEDLRENLEIPLQDGGSDSMSIKRKKRSTWGKENERGTRGWVKGKKGPNVEN